MSEWRPVVDWEDLYEVSHDGQVRSLPRETRTGPWGGVLRKPNRTKSGHLQVALWRESRRTTVGIHVLMMAAFVGPRPEGHEVRHLDGNPANNTLTNLVYGTRQEQRADDLRNGVNAAAAKTHCSKDHEYTPENTYVEPSTGYRRCRICMRAKRRS